MGQYVAEEALAEGHKVWGTYVSTPLNGTRFETLRADLTDPASLEAAFEASTPDWTFLPAALTGVDECEAHPDEAHRVNVEGPRAVARLSAERGSRLAHVSTDYVFDGDGGPYTESRTPEPVNVYGKTKRAGEKAVLEELPEALVLRISAVYGWNRLRSKPNSVTWIVDRLRTGQPVPLFTDQTVSPTYAAEAAQALLDLVWGTARGVMHFAPEECVSRLQLGELVAEVFDLPKELLHASTLAEAGLPAPRPHHICLRSLRLARFLKWKPRPLREALAHMREAE